MVDYFFETIGKNKRNNETGAIFSFIYCLGQQEMQIHLFIFGFEKKLP